MSVLPGAALSVLFGATEAHATDFLGAAFCRPCHTAAWEQWRRTPHARAFERLGPESRRDPRCTACHATSAVDGFSGVQCESCHGAGRNYATGPVMHDVALARAVGLRAGSEPELCARCHLADDTRLVAFDAKAALNNVRHRAPGAP